MTIDEMIAVLTAYRDGKAIQLQDKHVSYPHDQWIDCQQITWNFAACNYRVKPEPRTIWLFAKALPSDSRPEPPGPGYVKFVEVID